MTTSSDTDPIDTALRRALGDPVLRPLLDERVRLLVEVGSLTGAAALASAAADGLRGGIERALGITDDDHEGDLDLIARLTDAVHR